LSSRTFPTTSPRTRSESALAKAYRLTRSEPAAKELFDSTVGRVKRIQLSYKADGKSSGVATIEFSKPGDGSKAFAAYNGRLIDQS
jgi:THO complex subunit 4